MSSLIVGILSSILLLVGGGGGDEGKSPLNGVRSLIAEFDAEWNAFLQSLGEAPSDEARREIKESKRPPRDAWRSEMVSLAETHPGTEAAAEALTWVIANGATKDEIASIAQVLIRDHLDSVALRMACASFSEYSMSVAALELLEAVSERSGNTSVRELATYRLALVLKGFLRTREKMEELFGETPKAYAKVYGEGAFSFIESMDPVEVRERIEELLEDCLAADDESIANEADDVLFAFRDLRAGKQAPEISGSDLDGTPFKLSDYRGKVVLLDFWGHW